MKLDRQGERVVRALLASPGKKLDIWQLARQCGHIRDCIRAAESLARLGVVETEGAQVRLVNTNKLPAYLLAKEPSLKKIIRSYQVLRKKAHFANAGFDQLMFTPEAVEHKLALMLRRNDLVNRDILCVGDDDLFSIACALTGLPKSVTALDVDDTILAFIRSVSPRLPIPVRTMQHDLRAPLPRQMLSSFDVAITEPPETVKGTLLFALQGMQALREGGALYLGMTEVTTDTRVRHEVQCELIQSGLAFTDVVADYEAHEVEGRELALDPKLPAWINALPEKPWFVSTLFRGEVIEKKKIRVPRVTDKDFITTLSL